MRLISTLDRAQIACCCTLSILSAGVPGVALDEVEGGKIVRSANVPPAWPLDNCPGLIQSVS
jgi:hypothetical protein